MGLKMKKTGILILISFLLLYSMAEAKERDIHLKSRKFVPSEMTTEAAKMERIDQMRRGVKRIHGLIQLHRIPDEKERMDLEKAGIILLDYIPEDSWLVSISGGTVIGKEALSYIRWIGPLEPDDKISPGIKNRGPGPWARRPDGQVLLRVVYFRDVTPEEAKAVMESIGITVIKEVPELRTIEIAVEEGKIMKIAREDIVQWIEEVPPPPVPHNDGSRENTRVNVVQASPYNLSGKGVDVGQWDDGDVDSTHPDFITQDDAGNPFSRVTEVSNVGIKGDHATHVAGTMGGSGVQSATKGGNPDQWKGMVPGVQIFSYDFRGNNNIEEHKEAIDENKYGIEISNNSWGVEISGGLGNCDTYGNYGYDAPSYDQIVTGLYGKRTNIIFSAGNERDDGDCANLGKTSNGEVTLSWDPPTINTDGTPLDDLEGYRVYYGTGSWNYNTVVNVGNVTTYKVTGLSKTLTHYFAATAYDSTDNESFFSNQMSAMVDPYPYYANIPPPATAKNVITVGAINSDDNTMTDFSGWGPVDDGRIKPEVVAPGDEVEGDGAIKSTIPPDTYGLQTGTSMAAPAVSGAVALIIEDYRRLYGRDPLPSTVKALLIHGTQDLGNRGPDFSYGYGKINVAKAIDLLESESIIEDEVGHQESKLFYLTVPEGATSVKVTLVWDDEAATSNAAKTLVNDLDLIVRDPYGGRYYPWTLDPQIPSGIAVRITEDHTNNIEQVEVDDWLTPGTWTVEVYGYAVPVKAPQRYSLVLTPASSILGVSVSPMSAIYYSSDKDIPFGTSGVTSIMTVPEDLIISGMHVYVDISRNADPCCIYKISLTSPAGTTAVLFDQSTTFRTFQTWFDTQTVSKESLNKYVGENALGTWSLTVIDKLSGNAAKLNNWGIEVLTRSWTIGITAVGTTKTMTEAERFTVKNTGNITETFTLHISDTGLWRVASTGVDTFVMSAIFSAVTDNAISEGDFNTSSNNDDIILPFRPKRATSTDFANGLVTTKDGVNVPAKESRDLTLQFKAPIESTVPGSQRIVVTVGAMPP